MPRVRGHRSPLLLARWLFGLFLLWFALTSQAELQHADGTVAPRYLADIEVHSAAELESILQRADDLNNAGELDAGEPIVFVLHGKEGKVFLRDRYDDNKDLVDLAARLSALRVVDVRVCERWMGWQRIQVEELQPFITTVPSGPAEIDRLMDEGYVYF